MTTTTNITIGHRISSAALLLSIAAVALAHQGTGHGGDLEAHHTHSPAQSSTAEHEATHLIIKDCWIRAMPGDLPSAGYFTIRNEGKHAVTLSGVQSAAFRKTMLHRTVMQDDMARMEHVDGVKIAAGESASFRPGGYHAMLEQRTAPLAPGDTLAMTFQFGSAGQIESTCAVRNAAATSLH